MGVCHRISSPRGGGLVTMTVTNPHLAPVFYSEVVRNFSLLLHAYTIFLLKRGGCKKVSGGYNSWEVVTADQCG